jgi:hypothetical protein
MNKEKQVIKLKLTPEVRNFLQSGSMVSTLDGVNYFYMPYWFEIKDGEDLATPHHMNNLPKVLQEYIVKSRLGGDNPQPKQSYEFGIMDLSDINKHVSHVKPIDVSNDLIKGDPSKPVVQIWMEGYCATGESSTANMINQYHADSFDEAMKLYMEDHPGDVEVKKTPKNMKSVRDESFTKEYRIWACRLFDNETNARKSFG